MVIDNSVADIQEFWVDCPHCEGIGQVSEETIKRIYSIYGFSRDILSALMHKARREGTTECPMCDGKGYKWQRG